MAASLEPGAREGYIPSGLRNANSYLHPNKGTNTIEFLEKAFGAERLALYLSDQGVVEHARLRLGDTVLEMGDAHGPFQNMPTTFHFYVEDVEGRYSKSLEAGATSVMAPQDQPYGERMAIVQDEDGNRWCIARKL